MAARADRGLENGDRAWYTVEIWCSKLGRSRYKRGEMMVQVKVYDMMMVSSGLVGTMII